MFDKIPEPDLFMWNTMLRGSAQSSTPLLTISLFSRMERLGEASDHYTFPFVLKACTRLRWVNMGCVIHGKIVKSGFECNKFCRNTLIYFHGNVGDIEIAGKLFDDVAKRDVVAWSAMTAGYAKRGELRVARQIFDEMPEKDMVSWNVMITGYLKHGDMESARDLFNVVPKRDVVTWNAMISGYVSSKEYDKSLAMFEEMKECGEYPDEVTMLSLLSACAELGSLDVGEKMHFSIMEIGKGGFSVLLGNALIDMYAKCGSIAKALGVFHSMRDKDISTWNTIIARLALHGHSEEAISLFEKMRRQKFLPNDITFTGVLLACSHAGKVYEGRKYFKMMKDDYEILPNEKHYGCLVDVLGRAGLLNEAIVFINEMEIEPNAIIWRTLLAACKIHDNVEMGRYVNEQLLKLRNDHSGDYVLLSNLYASQGEWYGAQSIRGLMDDTGIKKERGSSLIDTDTEPS
ncbi:hypothetical protein LIER_19056 [Lithospermum erythrorhizon]|uniref:Pentatricopeptide repeat-containing protein n=1 Tax=Lithospermum erythrorhizon TaxID=34254 RepID=A0AAV3QHB4_LITER